MGYAPRFPCAERHLHVRNHATGEELLFRDARDFECIRWLLGREVVRQDWSCLAYCFMDNHVHLVIVPRRENVSDGMRNLASAYVRRFNERWERRGHLVERRYRVTAARDEPHLFEIMRYVPLNPVVAGLGDRPEDWPHSSYAATIGLAEPPAWLDVAAALRLFHRDPRRARAIYRAFVEQRLPPPRAALTAAASASLSTGTRPEPTRAGPTWPRLRDGDTPRSDRRSR